MNMENLELTINHNKQYTHRAIFIYLLIRRQEQQKILKYIEIIYYVEKGQPNIGISTIGYFGMKNIQIPGTINSKYVKRKRKKEQISLKALFAKQIQV